MPDTTPAVWSDGDPLMEAVAAAVWEQCRTENSIVVDDPRNIAAVAATVARQLLGTSAAEGAVVEPEPDTELRDRIAAAIRAESSRVDDLALADAVMPVVTDRLRRNWGEMRDRVAELETEAQRLADAAPPAPADRAAVLREAAEVAVRAARACGESETGQYAASVAAGIGRDLRRLADEAAAGVQQTTEGETKAPGGELPIVGYRSHTGKILRCIACAPSPYLIRTGEFVPVDSEDLPDGGFCTWHECGRDVLATPPAAPAAPEEPTR
ncbi:hypothetical protein [Streptomyces sp. rh34]|uniref:hypothetical protein n=1 Tax=Streptomyces sp. rh34 TaxID=2034272 RepID=UPI000BF0792A|nr:hypothetical protein [Streptomyces sp. rh34]